eukprot:5356004-Amphidinium_carterae.2
MSAAPWPQAFVREPSVCHAVVILFLSPPRPTLLACSMLLRAVCVEEESRASLTTGSAKVHATVHPRHCAFIFGS